MYPQIMKIYVDLFTSNQEEHKLLFDFLNKLRTKILKEEYNLSSSIPNNYGYIQVFCTFQQWVDIRSSELYSRASFQVKK